MQVCSHRSSVGQTDKGNDAPLLERMVRLAASGIVCYDIDITGTSDGQLVVGYPNHIANELRAAGRIVPPGQLDTIPWSEYVAAGLDKRHPLLQDVLAAFAEILTGRDSHALLEADGKGSAAAAESDGGAGGDAAGGAEGSTAVAGKAAEGAVEGEKVQESATAQQQQQEEGRKADRESASDNEKNKEEEDRKDGNEDAKRKEGEAAAGEKQQLQVKQQEAQLQQEQQQQQQQRGAKRQSPSPSPSSQQPKAAAATTPQQQQTQQGQGRRLLLLQEQGGGQQQQQQQQGQQQQGQQQQSSQAAAAGWAQPGALLLLELKDSAMRAAAAEIVHNVTRVLGIQGRVGLWLPRVGPEGLGVAATAAVAEHLQRLGPGLLRVLGLPDSRRLSNGTRVPLPLALEPDDTATYDMFGPSVRHSDAALAEVVAAAAKGGQPVVAWTVDSLEDATRVARAGAGLLVANDPLVMRDRLKAAAQRCAADAGATAGAATGTGAAAAGSDGSGTKAGEAETTAAAG